MYEWVKVDKQTHFMDEWMYKQMNGWMKQVFKE